MTRLSPPIIVLLVVILIISVFVFSSSFLGSAIKEDSIAAAKEDGGKSSPTTTKNPPPVLLEDTHRQATAIAGAHQHETAQQHCAASSPHHGNCRKWLASMNKRFFRIHHIHTHGFSIERKVVRLFGPSLARLYCKHLVPDMMKTTLKQQQQQQQQRFPATIVDIGVNDAEDIPYWFDRFGYDGHSSIFAKDGECKKLLHLEQEQEQAAAADSSSSLFDISFRLFEPQAMYREQIEKIFKEQLLKSNTLSAVTVSGQFDVVAVGSDAQHGTTALFYGKGEQASLGAKGKHAAVGKPVEVKVGSLSKMLLPGWKSDLAGEGQNRHRPLADSSSSSSSSSPILFMKVDCEGADPTIIVDSEPLFAAHRVHLLVFELHKNERGFPKKFTDSTAMLRSHGYAVYLVGRCQSAKGGVFFMQVDAKTAAAWTPVLEAGIALSPQLLEVIGGPEKLGSYFGGSQLTAKDKYICGADWQWVPNF